MHCRVILSVRVVTSGVYPRRLVNHEAGHVNRQDKKKGDQHHGALSNSLLPVLLNLLISLVLNVFTEIFCREVVSGLVEHLTVIFLAPK